MRPVSEVELRIRHAPADGARAQLLAQALEAFGYGVALSAEPLVGDGPSLFLWSPSAVQDDALPWEAAERLRADKLAGRPGQVYEALIAPCRTRVKLSSLNPPPDRLWRPADLSIWRGAADDDLLAPLIWELPPPRTPRDPAPFERPASQKEAGDRAVVASRDPIEIAASLTRGGRLPASYVRDRQEKVDAAAADIAAARAALSSPEIWRRYGPEAERAAASLPDDAGAALHTFGLRVRAAGRIEGLDDSAQPNEHLLVALMTAIQICAPDQVPCLTDFDPRTTPELERAAAKGDPGAMLRLAKVVLWGAEREKNLRLLEQAAEQNDLPAIRELARTLLFSAPEKAVTWMKRGVLLGCREMMSALITAYEEGDGVPRDRGKALELRRRLAGGGDGEHLHSGRELWDGDGVVRDREAAVRRFFRDHVVDGSAEADIHIGDLYKDGLGGLPRDRDEAAAWYRVSFQAKKPIVHEVARRRLAALGVAFELSESIRSGLKELDHEDKAEVRRFWTPRK